MVGILQTSNQTALILSIFTDALMVVLGTIATFPPNLKITRNGTTPLSDQVVIFPKVILLCQRVSNEI